MKKVWIRAISVCLILIFLVSAVSCGSSNTGDTTAPESGSSDTAETGGGTENDLSQKEAPELAEKVAAGELPPVEERMPVADDIMVEPDVMELGKYGGTLVATNIDSKRWDKGFYAEQSMFRFKQDDSGEVEANVAKDFYPNDDATVWTIEMREGMRWSDGEPFTADDVIFYYDHMSVPALNEDRSEIDAEDENARSPYTSKAYECYFTTVDDVRYWAEMEKVDDYKFTVTFKSPKPDFPVRVAVDNKWMFLPKHFYKNYVSRTDGVTDDASFPAITEEEALANANRDFGKQWESYSTMGKDIGYYHWDFHIIPQIRSFIAVDDSWDTVGETYRMVRNPYFWKTDSEGRQLPYLDSVEFKIINEQDQITLQATAGEFDFYLAEVDYSTVATATKDTHHVVSWPVPDWATEEVVLLNQTVKDPDKRILFQNKDFREALSIAVDRNLLNETTHNGVCTPAQAAVQEGVPGYDADWLNKWTEYDVERANELLDGLTEPWDRAEGTYRKMKGTDKELEIVFSVREAGKFGDYVSILQTAYRALGIRLSEKIDPEYRVTMLSNDIEASFEKINCVSPEIRPDALVPVRNVSFWHSAYGKWYEDGKSTVNGGVEPEGDVMELINAYEAMQQATGPDRDKIIAENVQKIYDLHKDNTWIIGFLTPLPSRNIVSNRLHNVPDGIVCADEYRFISHARPEQFWVD